MRFYGRDHELFNRLSDPTKRCSWDYLSNKDRFDKWNLWSSQEKFRKEGDQSMHNFQMQKYARDDRSL